MKKEVEKQNQKSLSSINYKSFISVVIVLLAAIIVSGLLTLFIPQGSFLRDEDGQIVAGTFTKGEVKGIALWRVITAPFRVFVTNGSTTIIIISLFLLIMSGVCNILDKTNGLKVLMNRLVKKFGKKYKIVFRAQKIMEI